MAEKGRFSGGLSLSGTTLVLYQIGTNRFWRVKFLFLFVGKPCNTAVLLRFPSLIKRNFTTTKLLCTWKDVIFQSDVFKKTLIYSRISRFFKCVWRKKGAFEAVRPYLVQHKYYCVTKDNTQVCFCRHKNKKQKRIRYQKVKRIRFFHIFYTQKTPTAYDMAKHRMGFRLTLICRNRAITIRYNPLITPPLSAISLRPLRCLPRIRPSSCCRYRE